MTAPARTLTAMLEVRGDGAVSGLTSVWGSLLELGEALTPNELEMPTACPGWTVKDQFSHVIGTELLLQGVGAPAPPRTYGPHVRNDLGALNERFVAARRAIPGQSVVAELAELVAHREAQLRRLEAEAAFAVGDGPVGIVPYVDYVSARTVDAFVHEQRRSAAVIGLDPAAVPGSLAELDAYYDKIRPSLYACPEARQALLRSYRPDVPAEFRPLKLMVPPLNTLAFASLPRWARKMYGAPGSPLTDVGATAALRVAHQSATRIPRRLLYLPAARAARRRRRERERRAAAA